MNQRELSFLYRGVFLFLVGGLVLAGLEATRQPWAQNAKTIAGLVWFVGWAGFVTFVTFRGFGQFLKTPARDAPLPPDLYSPLWFHAARLAVSVSVFLALVLVAVLLFVAPPEQCPNWRLPDRDRIPVWVLLIVFTLPILAGLSYIVTHWNWALRKAIASVDYPTTMPISYVMIMPVLFGSAMAQFPWALLITKCWMGS